MEERMKKAGGGEDFDFYTSSGSRYEVRGTRIRRVNKAHEKRADDKWIQLVQPCHVEVGHPVYLALQSLESYGTDDTGTETIASSYTVRTTTPVAGIVGV